MWGITGRGARLGEGKRSGRSMQLGTARIAVRGPVEHAVLDVYGELDFGQAERVCGFVADVPHRLVSIDVTGLEFIDGAGARAIEMIRADREALHGVRPGLIGATRAVERTLRFVRTRDAGLVPTA